MNDYLIQIGLLLQCFNSIKEKKGEKEKRRLWDILKECSTNYRGWKYFKQIRQIPKRWSYCHIFIGISCSWTKLICNIQPSLGNNIILDIGYNALHSISKRIIRLKIRKTSNIVNVNNSQMLSGCNTLDPLV